MPTIKVIEQHATNIRRNIIRMIAAAGSGHPAGSLGLADIFAALYFEILKFNPQNPDDPDRDILVVSNGHVCPVLYATLAEAGLIPEEELMTLRQFNSRLQGHPHRAALPWLETTSGPLGEGLSQAAGAAWVIASAAKQSSATENDSGLLRLSTPRNDRYVYCITGDGELDEGNIWEGAMFAAKYRLGNLIVIVDRNNIQLDGDTEEIMPLEILHDKWAAFGWQVIEIDGNNVQSIIDGCSEARAETDRPSVILAHTTPGKGVSFMENDYKWHGTAPDEEQARKALEELR